MNKCKCNVLHTVVAYGVPIFNLFCNNLFFLQFIDKSVYEVEHFMLNVFLTSIYRSSLQGGTLHYFQQATLQNLPQHKVSRPRTPSLENSSPGGRARNLTTCETQTHIPYITLICIIHLSVWLPNVKRMSKLTYWKQCRRPRMCM